MATKKAKSKEPQTPEQRIEALEEEVEKTHRELAFTKRALIEIITELAEEQGEDAVDLVNERVEAILEEASELD